jgi:hypothetical protein
MYVVHDKDFYWEAAGALPFPKVCYFGRVTACNMYDADDMDFFRKAAEALPFPKVRNSGCVKLFDATCDSLWPVRC